MRSKLLKTKGKAETQPARRFESQQVQLMPARERKTEMTNTTTRSTGREPRYQATTKEAILAFVWVRRGIRQIIQELDSASAARNQYLRQASILKHAGGPFNGSRIATFESLAKAIEPTCDEHRARLKGMGEFLLDMASTFDSVTTLTQRCEILGVNVADRDALTEDDGLVRIFNAHGLEDSAYHRTRGWKSGPLHESTVEIFIDFMLNTMEGRKLGDSLFEPGGLFEDVSLYRREQEGTMVRQPPRLCIAESKPPCGGEKVANDFE